MDVGDVHGAAFSVADAGRFAHELGDHTGDIDALGDAVPVAAVGAGEVVLIGEMGADTNRHGFFTGIEMHEAGDQSVGEVLAGGILEGADFHHLGVGVEKSISIG